MHRIVIPRGPAESDAKTLPRIRVAFVCNHSFAMNTLYRGLFAFLAGSGIDSEAVVGDDQYLDRAQNFKNVPIHIVPMEREPSIANDIVSLARFIGFFARHRYDVVHVSTPKAAFLGAIAARLTGQPRILFVVRTRIYEGKSGLGRWVYEKIDWLVSRLSDAVAPISREMGRDMVAEGLCPAAKIRYFGEGSSNGIDVHRFNRTPETIKAGADLRARHGIPPDAILMLSVGRLAREKGVQYLPIILDRLTDSGCEAWLLVAGPADSRDPTDQSILDRLDERPNVVRLGYQEDTVPLYAAADIFLFPSSREGFGNVALEAQALGLPVVGFDIPGVREAVANGSTGLLAPAGDGEAFADMAVRLVTDATLRGSFSSTATQRVREHFSNERIWGDIRQTLFELAGDRQSAARPAA